jgi:hypothetical protein
MSVQTVLVEVTIVRIVDRSVDDRKRTIRWTKVLWQEPELFCQEATESAHHCAANASLQGSKRPGLGPTAALWFNRLGLRYARG